MTFIRESVTCLKTEYLPDKVLRIENRSAWSSVADYSTIMDICHREVHQKDSDSEDHQYKFLIEVNLTGFSSIIDRTKSDLVFT